MNQATPTTPYTLARAAILRAWIKRRACRGPAPTEAEIRRHIVERWPRAKEAAQEAIFQETAR